MVFDKIKIRDAIRELDRQDGSEYLGRFEDRNWYWEPSKKVVEQFKRIIGDKWLLTENDSMIKRDLKRTNIVVQGNFIVAKGGLCPSGVRLFEIEDMETLENIIKEKVA